MIQPKHLLYRYIYGGHIGWFDMLRLRIWCWKTGRRWSPYRPGKGEMK
jgi:predicted alpha/beta-fold hydrolase